MLSSGENLGSALGGRIRRLRGGSGLSKEGAEVCILSSFQSRFLHLIPNVQHVQHYLEGMGCLALPKLGDVEAGEVN